MGLAVDAHLAKSCACRQGVFKIRTGSTSKPALKILNFAEVCAGRCYPRGTICTDESDSTALQTYRSSV